MVLTGPCEDYTAFVQVMLGVFTGLNMFLNTYLVKRRVSADRERRRLQRQLSSQIEAGFRKVREERRDPNEPRGS